MASRKNPDTTKKSKKKDAQAEKKPVGKRRDAEGNWIGDDGLDMTPARKRLHHLFDAYFIWGIILALAAVVFLVLSYFQGAQYQTWELVASGGNQFNGWDTALLMRYETVFLLLSGVVFILANFFGFAWLYDRKPDTRLRVALIALIAVSAVYFLLAVVRVGTPEPGSLINILLAAIALATLPQARADQYHLQANKKKKAAKAAK